MQRGKKECIEHWLTVFHEFQTAGLYNGDFLNKNLVGMCFMGILQVITFILLNWTQLARLGPIGRSIVEAAGNTLYVRLST